MRDESQQIADMIRSGEYFKQSRAWYQALYIGPIAERSFFLIVAILASFIALFSILALSSSMPLTSRPGVLISNERLNDAVPSVTRIREGSNAVNPSLMQFFVLNYVTMRETYNAKDYLANFKFIQNHSNAATYASYASLYDSRNPQSPAAILGTTGERVATVTSININSRATPQTATVRFTTELQGVESASKTRWTATLQFNYSDLTVTDTIDPETGEHVASTQDPQFQVVNYALSQAP